MNSNLVGGSLEYILDGVTFKAGRYNIASRCLKYRWRNSTKSEGEEEEEEEEYGEGEGGVKVEWWMESIDTQRLITGG